MGSVAHVLLELSSRYGVPVAALTGQRRTDEICVIRHAAFAEVKARRPNWSLTQIGRAFGGRDHTTVLYGLRRHHARMAWVEALRACATVHQPDLFEIAA